MAFVIYVPQGVIQSDVLRQKVQLRVSNEAHSAPEMACSRQRSVRCIIDGGNNAKRFALK
jgi:hypothetical protein